MTSRTAIERSGASSYTSVFGTSLITASPPQHVAVGAVANRELGLVARRSNIAPCVFENAMRGGAADARLEVLLGDSERAGQHGSSASR